MRLGRAVTTGSFFLSCQGRNNARVPPEPSQFYLAWGCFRYFVSGLPRAAPPKGAAPTSSRTQKPASLSTAAQSLPRSARGTRWRPNHDYAYCTYRARCWSKFIKNFETSLPA